MLITAKAATKAGDAFESLFIKQNGNLHELYIMRYMVYILEEHWAMPHYYLQPVDDLGEYGCSKLIYDGEKLQTFVDVADVFQV